jgi:alanine-glyoxylate transaminase/(R)-3-amino-2-methylpropionate-pyruvate transaminase
MFRSVLRNSISSRRYFSDFLAPSCKTFKFFPPECGEVEIYGGHGTKVKTQYGELIDCMSQNLCISVGYGNPEVDNAVRKQQTKVNHVTTMFYNETQYNAAKELVKTVPHYKHHDYTVHFTSSGSEAVDLAIQMAYIRMNGGRIVSLTNAYHGVQGYAASVTDVPSMHSFPGLYSNSICEAPSIENIDNLIDSIVECNSTAAVIVEPIQGYGGVIELPSGFMVHSFNRIQDIGGVTICDEIQTGFGRTGKSFWGFQSHIPHKDLYPDIITFAKGAGNGYPIAGVIVKRSIAEAFCKKKTFNTFAANPLGCVALSAVIKVIKQQNLMQRSNLLGDIFRNRVSDLVAGGSSPFKQVRGSGLLQGIEVNGDMKCAVDIQWQLLRMGVLMGRGGPLGNVLRFQPPMCLTVDELLRVIKALEQIKCN